MTDQAPAPPERRRGKIILQYAVMILLLWWIFFEVLPNLIDYQAVWEVITSLETEQFLLLLLFAAARDFSESAVYTTVVPGLGFWPGWQVYEASTSTASLMPPGFDFAVRYAMYRGFGVPPAPAGQAMALSAVFTLGLKWALPAIALITLLIVSPSGWETSTIFWLILAASVGVVSIGALVLQSERAASWLGRHVEYWNNRFLAGHWKFEEASGMEAQIVNWRDEMVGTLRHIWPAGFGWALGSQTLSFIVLALSMSFVGLTSEEIPFLALFVAFSVGLIASMVPILPQGVGAVEFVYIWILSGEFGSDLANQIAAAAFVHRVFIWFLPMLVGVIPLVMWRRRMKKHPERNPFATTG